MEDLTKIAKEGSNDLSHFLNVGPDGCLYRKKYKVKALGLADSDKDLNFENERIYNQTLKTGIYVILENKQ